MSINRAMVSATMGQYGVKPSFLRRRSLNARFRSRLLRRAVRVGRAGPLSPPSSSGYRPKHWRRPLNTEREFCSKASVHIGPGRRRRAASSW
jgi:hypothetical protein